MTFYDVKVFFINKMPRDFLLHAPHGPCIPVGHIVSRLRRDFGGKVGKECLFIKKKKKIVITKYRWCKLKLYGRRRQGMRPGRLSGPPPS